MENLLREIKFKKREGELDIESARYFYKKYKQIDNLERRPLTRREYRQLKDYYNSKNKTASAQRKTHHLFNIIPKSSRQEAIADIHEIIFELKESGHHKFYIRLIVFLNVASVLYYSLFFRLKGYFYPGTQHVTRD